MQYSEQQKQDKRVCSCVVVELRQAPAASTPPTLPLPYLVRPPPPCMPPCWGLLRGASSRRCRTLQYPYRHHWACPRGECTRVKSTATTTHVPRQAGGMPSQCGSFHGPSTPTARCHFGSRNRYPCSAPVQPSPQMSTSVLSKNLLDCTPALRPHSPALSATRDLRSSAAFFPL